MRLSPSEIIANRYEIIEKLGTGGMAVVYKAKDVMLDRFVTFKVLKEEHLSDKEVSSNFGTEAKAAARLNHQNIVRVFDTGVHSYGDKDYKKQNIHYIVMEYIDGNTIKELIRERAYDKKFTENEALGVSLQIAKALAHAHENNVVHRDIKPQNILITEDGDVKVTDFGIALRRAHSDTTVASESMGSVHYSSPEQSRGRFVDGRSDIYSLGIVMFEMLTGKLPFDGDNPVTIALKHVNEPIPNIAELAPEVSEKFIYIIKKCTAKLANQRYNNVYELIDDLKRLLEIKSREDDENYDEDVEEYEEDEYEEENPTIKLGRNLEFERNFKSPHYKNNSQYTNKNKKSQNLKIIALASTVVTVFVAIVVIILLLNFNDSTEHLEMPNLIGLTQDEISEFFEGHLIYIDIEEILNADVPEGTVFSQSIMQGTILEHGDRLTLQISYSPTTMAVPNLVGHILADVLTIEYQYNQYFNFHSIQEFHEDVPLGTVFSQYPEAGTNLVIGEVLFYYVSRGPISGDSIIVPNFINMFENELHEAVSVAGLVIGDVSRLTHETPEGTVFHQSVPANSSVFEGHEVNFIVSSGPILPPEEEEEEEEIIEPTETSPPYEESPYEHEIEPPHEEEEILLPFSINIEIPFPSILVDEESAYISVILQTVNAGNELIMSGEFHVSEFPLPTPVTGDGPGFIMIFVNDILYHSESINP